MIKISNPSKTLITIKGIFADEKLPDSLVQIRGELTEYLNEKIGYIFLGKKDKYDEGLVKKIIKFISSQKNRSYQIDLKTFTYKDLNLAKIMKWLVLEYEYQNYNLYSMKKAAKNKRDLHIINIKDKKLLEIFKNAQEISKAINWVRDLQIYPNNYLTSIKYEEIVKERIGKCKNLKLKILDKKEIKKLGMNLLLAVNAGSKYEPRVIVIEYLGDPASKEKTVMVGKGITFDSGGYNIKFGGHMATMKFDMSGSAVVAGVMEMVSKIKPKKNVSAVMVITDNMVNEHAYTPDMIFKAMNGKYVEVNNTDAEGRLALADGLTYGAKVLKGTRLISIATLTGAILYALGKEYSGVWASKDSDWKAILKAAKTAEEKIWRMPMDKCFLTFMKKTPVADLYNTNLSGAGGSSSAAMFLKEFTENKDFVHIDIAGTANKGPLPTAVMVKTLVELNK